MQAHVKLWRKIRMINAEIQMRVTWLEGKEPEDLGGHRALTAKVAKNVS